MWRIVAGLAAFLLLGTGAARAEWRRAESPNFVMYGNLSETALRTRILQLEDFDRLLRALTVAEEPPARSKLHVYIVADNRDLETVRDLPSGAAGFYSASVDGMAAFVASSLESGLESDNVFLFHEYAHHFLLQTGAVYPAWFVEGFAEYFSTARFSAQSIDFGRVEEGRALALVQLPWLSMDRLLTGGSRELNRDQVAVYYSQSWLLTHYFYSTAERQAALGRLLAASRRQPPAEALSSATGLSFATLNTQLRRYIGTGRISYRRLTRASAAAAPAVTVTLLPRSAPAMILYEAALRIGLSETRAAPYVQRIRTAAARHPDDPLAMRVLAHAEVMHGDPAAGDRLLDRLLAATPNDAELLYLRGMGFLRAAQGNNPPDRAALTARRWFTRAHTADPNHFQTLYRYVQSLRGEPAFLTENARNVLLDAFRLAPQVSEIRMVAAAMLISRREFAEAIALLAPLAESPHDGDTAQQARRMIAEAEAALRAPAPTPGGAAGARPATGN